MEWEGATFRHAALLMELGCLLGNFASARRLGRVVSGVTVRILESERDARVADIAFYRRGRRSSDPDAAATRSVPDLVVEITSPSDRADRVAQKVRDWLRAGVPLLWYVDPIRGSTTTYQGSRVAFVDADEVLDGGDVIPGFQVKLRDLLDRLAEEDVEAP